MYIKEIKKKKKRLISSASNNLCKTCTFQLFFQIKLVHERKEKMGETASSTVFILVLLSTCQHNSSNSVDMNVCLAWLKSAMPWCGFAMWTRRDLKL